MVIKEQWNLSNIIAVIVCITSLLATLFATYSTNKSNRDLEEKRLETSLVLNSINIEDPVKTRRNIAFLMKAGLISDERQKILENLSDSVSVELSSDHLTSSDSCIFYYLTVLENEKEAFQGVSLITFKGIEADNDVKFQAFTDNFGYADLSFPSLFQGKSFLITVERNGYRTQSFEYTFPANARQLPIPRKKVLLTR